MLTGQSTLSQFTRSMLLLLMLMLMQLSFLATHMKYPPTHPPPQKNNVGLNDMTHARRECTIETGRALMKNTALRILDLRTNSITEKGAMFLAVALETNMHILKLYLFGNHVFDTELMQNIDAALQRNQDSVDFEANAASRSDYVMERAAKAVLEKDEMQAAIVATAESMEEAAAAAAAASAAAEEAMNRYKSESKPESHDAREL